jgi:hypothetical protein
MGYNNEQEVLKIELFLDTVQKRMKSTFKEAVKEAAYRVIDRTPTFFEEYPESGNTKANWNMSVDTPDLGYDKSKADYQGQTTIAEANNKIHQSAVTTNTTFYLSNASPAIIPLELGLYPKTPLRGSYNKYTKTYEIRSAGGYSKQAPQGIVGIVALEWPQIVQDAKNKIGESR